MATRGMTKKEIADALANHKAIQDALTEEARWYREIGDAETARAKESEKIAQNQKLISELLENYNKLTVKQKQLLTDLQEEQKELIKNEKAVNAEIKAQEKTRIKINAVLAETNRQIKIGLRYLMDSDKIIKSTVLNLGMSGTKAEFMRASFEQSAGYVARLGGSLEDVGTIMTGYADETGRARVMSAEMVKDITAIGKGTGLGIEAATKLGAQFELMGFDAKTTMDYVQGVVDTTERMGVNTTKVLKNVNDNFKRLNLYTFQQGVKGMAQMAAYAEKFRVDVGQALNAADVARSLEGAINLAAQLQIMGGEFSKTDPFELLFLARNDPAKFTEKIADMTKGVVTFRKVADGTFEKFISPADRDRLAAVAKSLGMETSALTEIAERQAEIQRMRQQMAGMGLSSKEKEIVEGAAIFNKTTGRFEVQLAGHMRDVTTLTKTQADAFVKERKSLEARALEAQTFEGAFKATINELKSALLPLLKTINGVLTAIRPVVVKITEFLTGDKLLPGWVKVGLLFLSAGALWKGILQPGAERIGKATVGRMAERIRGTAIPKEEIIGGKRGGGFLGKTGGKAMAGAGAGVGAAALGIGVGIGAAAGGISLLANAMSKLDEKQAETLKSIVRTLGWFILGGVAAAVGVAAFGTGAAAAAPGLLAFGAAVALVGVGVGTAAAGIGIMGMGLAQMMVASKGAGENLKGVAIGIGGIALATAGSAGGLIAFTGFLNRVGKHAPEIASVGETFKQINAVLAGSADDYIKVQNAIEAIAKANIRGGGMFADLANILNKPLRVEFADKRLTIASDITLDIDGDKFMRKVVSVPAFIKKYNEVQTQKGS
jgi:hypothetical protein